jgi:NAD(P)-dependent dehydrogenase (short-subunit alcohol dehydrogenase family)
MAPTALLARGANPTGRAIAQRLASEGYDVAVGFHESADQAHEIVEIVEDAGREATLLPGRLADPIVARQRLDRASAELSAPERVVVGPRERPIGVEGPGEEAGPDAGLDPSHVDAVLAADLKGPLAVLNGALEASSVLRFVALASAHRLRCSPSGVGARSALAALETAIAEAGRRADGFAANLVVPGPIVEPNEGSENVPDEVREDLPDPGPGASASKVADVVVHALEGPPGLTGSRLDVGETDRPVERPERDATEAGGLGRPGIEQSIEGPPEDHVDLDP